MIFLDYFNQSTHVPDFLFVLFVTLATVVPRMPLDEPWSIGGNLSQSFRKVLVLTTASHIFRNLFLTKTLWDGMGGYIGLTLQACEGILLCFLSLLTPYLLRLWLSHRIHLGRQTPGKALQPWIFCTAALNILAVTLRIGTGNDELWVLKKMADTLSFIPVMQTLQLYNRVTNSQTRYAGRGSVLSQVVSMAEYFALLMNGSDMLSKILFLFGWVSHDTLHTPFVKGMYKTNTYAYFTRILCHGILLNVLDEAYTIGSLSSSSTSSSPQAPSADRGNHQTRNNGGPTVETVDDLENEKDLQENLELVSLIM